MNSTFLLGAAGGIQWGDFLFYLVTFVILIAALKHFAWDSVAGMMEERADRIANDIDSAEANRIKAEELAKKREIALKDSHIEASQILEQAKQNGEEQKASIIAEAHSEATALKKRAHTDIEQERKAALASVKDEMAELSIEIASKVIQKELDANGHIALVDSYIEGLGKQDETR